MEFPGELLKIVLSYSTDMKSINCVLLMWYG